MMTSKPKTNERFKLRMNQPRYIIQPQSKVVVCIMECSIPHLPYNCHILRKFHEVSGPAYHFTVKGTAKCGPRDTYDEQTGMRIAESKAKEKAISKANKIMQHYRSIVKENLNVIENSIEFFDRELYRENSHLCDLMNK